ncbi:MAG: hypothetical protein GY767_14030 [Shimia sp.]|nr:hypothetical protein [Shimia sp.]
MNDVVAPFLNQSADGIADALNYLSATPTPVTQWPRVFGSFIAGQGPPAKSEEAQVTLEEFLANPSEAMGQFLTEAITGAGVNEPLQLLGALVYDTSIATITGQGLPPDDPSVDRARSFVGYVTALGALPAILDSVVEAASLGQIDQIGRNIQNVYWNLGLGFLTWQTMAPLLQAAILEPLERAAQKQWRGARFTRAQLQDLYALGEITQSRLVNELAEEGWREDDIDKVIALSFRTLSRADIMKMWHEGIIESEEVITRLRALGYDTRDIGNIMLLDVREEVQEDRTESISVLTRSFTDGFLTEDEFRQLLDDNRYSPQEIDLRVKLVRAKQEGERRQISLAQIKSAWDENLLGDVEAKARVRELGYPQEEAALLFDTWERETDPPVRKINRSTTLSMYRLAVINRGRAGALLLELGYSEDDGELLLQMTEARYPEDFGKAPSSKQRFLSLRSLRELFLGGRVGEDRVLVGLQNLGFTGDELNLQAELLTQPGELPDRPLTQSTIEDAYVVAVFNRPEARAALSALAFTEESITTILDTVEAENPAVFAPEEVSAQRQPTIGALVEGFRNGFVNEAEFYRRASEIGFGRDTAGLYLANATVGKAKSGKAASKTDVLKFYREGLVGYSEAHDMLQAVGYDYRTADLLLRAEKGGVEGTDIWQALLAGALDPNSAFLALLTLGFSEEDINVAIGSVDSEEIQ